jgi:hypothetical protein
MAKVFRLHEGQDGTGWFTSTPITKEQLHTIKTEGKDVATSIPSPFARVDLVKSAFRWVTDNGINGQTPHHKLVSDSLDVAQLFYASQKFIGKIEIVAWNPKERFMELIEQGNGRHSVFASTLQLFWNQDSVPEPQRGDKVLYNFEAVRRLYFLLNRETNQIIGGTSPATLFFASPDARKVTETLNIRIGQDKLFDDEFASLGHREASFVEYMYSLEKQPGFANFFPEVFSYMEEIRENHLTGTLRQKVSNFDTDEVKKYYPCPVLQNVNDPCEIIGIPLGIQIKNGSDIENESDFVIKSDFQIYGLKPLVLPYHRFSKNWTYTTHGIFWDENTEIPNRNSDIPEESKLPIQHDHYPWLTIGNFLEEKIIELPYPIDDTKFRTCGSKKYLLPLTPTFFKYFSPDKISNFLKIEERTGGLIIAELKIPVKGGEITFKKNYSTADRNIEKFEIHLAIFPFIKSNNININYIIGLLDDRLEKSDEVAVQCYGKGIKLELVNPITRNPGIGGEVKSIYYKTNVQFDSLRFGNKNSKGFIIPSLKECSGNRQINFAIDFGTTNTHIEYQHGDNEATAFDNDATNPLWQSLLKRNGNGIDPEKFVVEMTFEQEILPYSFSNNDKHLQFPLRTAIVHNKQLDYNSPIDVIRHANNYFLLEKVPIRGGYLELFTDLKWSNYADALDEKKVESYIEFIITIVFFKTLLLGGDTKNSTITWFYPVSMDEGELGVFFKLWKNVYKKVFNQDATEDKILGIPESIAPYLYYKSSVEGLSLSIDIGGGSSDIAVFDEDDNKAKLISSFKFAGNAIFGDGYPHGINMNNSDRNGFVNAFTDAAYAAVKGDKQKEGILNNILKQRKNSSDFSSYLFALERENNAIFSYSRLLEKDKRLKLTILVFYAAIAYYSANLLKKSGIGIPKYILLSGTASKSATIIDSSNGFRNLSSMFKYIFEKVYNEKSLTDMSIRLSPIPKEVTCKGSLKANMKESIKNVPIKFWIGGMDDNIWGAAYDKETDIQRTPKYRNLDETSMSDIESAIKDFYSVLDEYINSIRLEAKFIIEPNAYDEFQKIREEGIKDFLLRGINAYYKKKEDYIEESLFFYPLIGILNKLSFALSQNDV